MGGIDWAGFHVVAAYLRVTDLTGLMQRLQVLRLHRPPADKADNRT